MTESVSAAEARRLAVGAQGLAAARPARVGSAQLRALVEQLGVVQIDSVNVLVRSHYLPAWSRLGAYDRAQLDALSHDAPRAVFEYWGHEASLLPVALYPVLRWRMARAQHEAWGRLRRMQRDRAAFVRDVLAVVAERGPIGAGDIELGRKRKQAGWWSWSDAKQAIEWLFWAGEVTSARRRGFERLYDLPARVLPREVLDRPAVDERDAWRELITIAARALGVATEADLRDYYRLKLPARAAIGELVDAGVLVPVTVEGWTKPAFRHRDASRPRSDPARTALLSPFDSLVWARERTERLFGMKFRLEIYTPAPRRVHGYYVLPFLLGDRLVARVDLKADRASHVLRVQAAHLELGERAPRVAAALARELTALAQWLDLDRIEVAHRGDLAPALSRARGLLR